MGNTISFNNVTQVVETRGGLLLDASTFANMTTHGPLGLAFNTVWVVEAGEDTPIGPYETTSPLTYENLSGRWSDGVESGDNTWTVMWSPEGSEGVKFTLVRWLDMSHGQLDTFQHGFNACLKKRLDSPGAMPLSSHSPYSFDALEVYIQSQKALLARTHSDIDRLRLLREQATANPEHFFDTFDEKLNNNVFHFDHQPDIATEVQDKIDWDIFKGQGALPSFSVIILLTLRHEKILLPLRAFAADLRAAHYARSQPSTTQQTALSSAQQLVRRARRSIIEPVLASFELSSDSSDGEQLAPENLRPAREREQLRRIHLRNKGGLTLRTSGVHVRRDIGDESADVDIATTDGGPVAATLTPGALMTSASDPVNLPSPRPTRSRRPPNRPPATTAKAKVLALQTNQRPEPNICPPAAANSKKEKPKSETYKQAWSISEQHLLERLLTEIPDGEKNRWSKISKAMGGRRTPRQVASRVQKYFEKLKLFGVNASFFDANDLLILHGSSLPSLLPFVSLTRLSATCEFRLMIIDSATGDYSSRESGGLHTSEISTALLHLMATTATAHIGLIRDTQSYLRNLATREVLLRWPASVSVFGTLRADSTIKACFCSRHSSAPGASVPRTLMCVRG
ncbi:hypothetical protein EDB86DRAFT_2831045 [Lactarius hatsudake]|nr:hypothetical protein EDB86DRAFT_2831045 [Lactarius hatsudake]